MSVPDLAAPDQKQIYRLIVNVFHAFVKPFRILFVGIEQNCK